MSDPAPRWIPVTERFPECYRAVIVRLTEEGAFAGVFTGRVGRDGNWSIFTQLLNADTRGITLSDCGQVSHWAPLPEPLINPPHETP